MTDAAFTDPGFVMTAIGLVLLIWIGAMLIYVTRRNRRIGRG